MSSGNVSTRGRQTVVWALAVFVLLQLSLTVAADYWLPGLRYPEYGRKLAMLQRLCRERGSQPSLVALGTSRMAFGFSPSAGLAAHDWDGEWQFNFALTGQGPIQELLCFERLLDAGVRPRRLLIEIHPPLLHQAFPYFEPGLSDLGRLNWADLGVIARHTEQPRKRYLDWFWSRLAPWHTHRHHLLGRIAPWLLTELQRTDRELTRETDAYGWSKFPVRPSDDANRLAMEKWSVGLYVDYLRDFEVSEAPRGAIGEIIAICRREQIEPALVLMPECERFRAAYPPAASSAIDRWLEEIRRKHNVVVFACRDWCADQQFCDGHHMVPEGAELFSARLEDSALRPWLAQTGARPAAEVADRPATTQLKPKR